eukprot:3546892-Rhodomonas_salina.1
MALREVRYGPTRSPVWPYAKSGMALRKVRYGPMRMAIARYAKSGRSLCVGRERTPTSISASARRSVRALPTRRAIPDFA